MDGLPTLGVFVGAGAGAVLRWRLGLWLAAVYPAYPVGTHVANFTGCLLIGIAAGWFDAKPDTPAALRLLVTTGFLGGYTTFSAFSLEIFALAKTRFSSALALTAGTVSACLVLTALGFALGRFLATRGW